MGSPRKLIIVAGSEHGTELLAFLSKRLGLSRNHAKRLLDARAVFVNNRRIWMARHPLTAGDRVEATVATPSPPPAGDHLPVLYRDDAYLVVNKPAGLLANGGHSAESVLRTDLGQTVYAVHRLDRDTSGCLVLATSVHARDEMIPLFQAKEVKKIYHAVVFGSFPKSLHTIREPIDNQSAVTHVSVIKATNEASLLKLELETGRTHQIRKHLSAVRHPVVGDRSYMTGEMDSPALRHAPRQMLHASEIAFARPQTGAHVSAQARPPPDFLSCLASLRLGGLLQH